MEFYYLKATLCGGGDCDLTTCGLDQMLTFRGEQYQQFQKRSELRGECNMKPMSWEEYYDGFYE